MVLANPSKFLPEDEHTGKVFDNPGYQSALKKSGYTHEEAEKWWNEHPTGVLIPAVSISLNKDTGNIKVSAPKSMYESDSFKEIFKSSDLETLSRLYKASPNAKVETSEGEMVSIEDMVKKYDDAIKKYATVETSTQVAKQLMSETLGENAQKLTEDQLIRMGATGQATDEKSTLSIPKTVSSLFPKIADLGTFSDDSVTREDFIANFYNLSKTSDDEIVKLRKTVDAYFEKGDFSDLDEFAKMYALRDFIYKNEPAIDYWEEKGLAGAAILEGAARATASFTAGLLSIPQGMSDLLVNAMEGGTALVAGMFGQEYTPRKPSEVSFDLINTGIEAVFGTEYLNEELQNQYNERAEYYYTLNRSVATSFMLSNLLTSIAENVIAGKALGTMIENLVSATTTQNIMAATAGVRGIPLDAHREVMQAITGTANPSFWQTIKALSAADTTKIFTGAKAVIGSLSAVQGGVASAELAKVVSYATQTLKTGRAIATGANFIAQVTLDTTLASPAAIRRIIGGEATEEDKQIYLREVAWNAAGYGAGILLTRAANSFAKTKVGEAANAWATQQMASAKTAFHDMLGKLKTKAWGEDWLKNIGNPGKRQVARYNEIITEANRQVANATADIGSTGYAATQTQAVKDARARAIAVQNAVDNAEAGIRYLTNLYMGGNIKDASATYYPALSDSLRKATQKESDLAKMLNNLGISTNERPTALVNGVATNLGVPQDIINYPTDLYAVEYLTRKQPEGLSESEQKGLEIAQRRIALFESTRPENLVNFLKNEYLPALYDAYRQINIHREEAHIESALFRAGLIESGLFGEKGDRWIHLQAVTDFQKNAVDNTNRLSRQLSGFAEVESEPNYFHYSWGKENDYVHPQLALQNYIWETAVRENARNMWENFSPIYKEKTDLLVPGEQTEAAQAFKNLRKSLSRSVNKGIQSISEDLYFSDLVKKIVETLETEKQLEKAASRAEKAKEAVEKITFKEYKLTQADKLSAVMSLSDETISEILGEESLANLALSKKSWDDFIANANTTLLTEIRVRFYEQRRLTGFRSALSFDNYQKTLKFNTNLNSEIDRVRLKQDKKLWDNKIILDTAQEQKRAKDLFNASTTLKDSLSQLNLPTANDKYEAILAVQDAIKGFEDILNMSAATRQVIDAIAINVAPDNLEVARHYISLKLLNEKRAKKGLEIALVKLFNKEKFSAMFKKSNPGQVEKAKRAVISLVMDELKNELDEARQILKNAGETIIDEKDVMAEIKDLVQKIDKQAEKETVVAVYNTQGQMELYSTDPVLADLYNYRPVVQPSKAEIVFGNPVFRTMNRIARFFQTTVNPKSYKNQFFRDFGNSYFSTGAYKAMGMISFDLQVEYGGKLAEKLIEDLKVSSPSTYEVLTKQASETGTDIKQLVVDRYLSFGRITSPAETPTTFYREPFERSDSFASTLKQTKSKLSEFANKILEKLETPGQAREVYLRNSTYARGLSEGLESGLTVKEAQNAAQFFQRNGTTNFARQLYHFRALQKTVNYFGAGVNGFTSFWRLFSLDPVGVSTRIFSGLIIPTIFATATTLANEENREKYIHLPEYYKENQFIFMMNGEFYRIPIPQELNNFIAPVRQAVESLFSSNRNAFEELLLSDFLNIGPVDFGEIMMLDRDRLISDAPTFLERTGALGLSLIDQTMPNALKLVFQSTTGIDTYTGDQIDNSYWMIDDDNNRVLVGGTTSKFALKVAEMTGASPSIIAHIVDSLVGQVGEDVLDVVFGEEPGTLLENTLSGLTSFQTADYDLIDSEWNSTIGSLWREKEQTYLPAYIDYSSKINATSDPKEQEALRAKRQDVIQPFLDKVKTAVGILKSSYGGSYDRFRFASVVSLLTFDTGTTTGNTNEARLAEKETFYENRNNAYWWMTKNGLDASTDASMLGYLTKNKDGKTVVKYNTPTSILAARDALYGKSGRDVANIQTILDDNGLTRSKMFGDAYNKAKVAGKTAFKRYKAEWNTKVVKALAPYIGSRGVESTLESFAVRDLLDNYLFIDNPYQTKEYLTKIFGGK